MKRNVKILEWIEGIGGSYLWDKLMFVVDLSNTTITDKQLKAVSLLDGVEQIVLINTNVTFEGVSLLCRIESLNSLVVIDTKLTQVQVNDLSKAYPTIEFIFNDKT